MAGGPGLRLAPPAGGALGPRHPPHEVPRVASLQRHPAARGRQPAPDGGHAGRAALCHCGEPRPWHGRLCAQHCALPQAEQPHLQVRGSAREPGVSRALRPDGRRCVRPGRPGRGCGGGARVPGWEELLALTPGGLLVAAAVTQPPIPSFAVRASALTSSRNWPRWSSSPTTCTW